MHSADADTARRARRRVSIDGKQFALGGERFTFRGVTYGTFRPREQDGARFPEPSVLRDDFSAIRDRGFTVVRTYTLPPDDVIEAAADADLMLLAGAFHPDFRYLVGASRREARRIATEWRREIERATRQLANADHVLALGLGNELPADVIRWMGSHRVARIVADLADVVRSVDGDRLVTYANYPTAEYLPLDDLDFLTFNVYLERQADFRRYLTRLQNLAGDRPLVLGELGLDSKGDVDGEREQATALDWQLETCMERGVAGTCVFSWTDEWWVGDAAVEGWSFGLTHADRTPKPALDVAELWNHRDVSDLEADWPSISVVVCAYNAAATLDECLRHATALDYPDLEIIVVDDGSTDATSEIAARHPRVRLVPIPHAGLSVARNEGFRAATGQLIAYLDSDAYPPREWPYFLALALDGRNVGGAGGPNLPPLGEPAGALAVAQAPGGPAHVLISDDRAEHVPGCNMAFWRTVLEEVGGFDPVYTAAGDDVDLCWKVTDIGWEIGFHPAAFVWHHRRAGTKAFLRQQRGYGRAEALVAARHPHRFTDLGTARWRGRIYVPGARAAGRQRIYHGPFGVAPFQSVYQTPAHGLDIAHQIAVPITAASLATLPIVVYEPAAALVPLAVFGMLAALFVADSTRVQLPRAVARQRLRFRATVALLHLLQPAVRWWGRLRNRTSARREAPGRASLPGPVHSAPGGVLVFPADVPREVFAQRAARCLAAGGLRVVPSSGWEPYDARIYATSLVRGRLLTSAFPEGAIQARIDIDPRYSMFAVALVGTVFLRAVLQVPYWIPLSAVAFESVRGIASLQLRSRRALLRAVLPRVPNDPAIDLRPLTEIVLPVTRLSPVEPSDAWLGAPRESSSRSGARV
jgi:O-antigen biosynthesis protein